ncbi:MAG TPA: replicative DNA helicase [Candidatus Brocadiia bacterium]|nr:replicative DNA helicase [Candidatus Brocadiia bacterium]
MGPEGAAERVPPYDLDAEMGVLGSMLLDNDAIDLALRVLTPDSFYKDAHRLIFETIVHCYHQYNTVDPVILRDELKKIPPASKGAAAEGRTALDDAGGVAYILDLEEAVPTVANVEYYAGIVREKAIRRKLIETASEIQKEAYMESADVEQLLDRAEREVFELKDLRSTRQVQKVSETLKELIRIIDRRAENDLKGAVTGMPTGFNDLNNITSGFQNGEFIIVAARPSVGKTSLLLNILHHVAYVERKPVVLYSLEMSAQQIVQNMLSLHCRIEGTRLRTVDLDDHQYQDLFLAVNQFAEVPLYIDDSTGLNILELRAKARRLKERYGIAMVAVDYLQLMEPTASNSKSRSREQEVSEISRGLKGLARELNVPVIAAAQLNRGVESRLDHRPRLADLRESGSIEQDADVVALIHREDVATGQYTREATAIELIIAKQRNGPQGIVNLTFWPNMFRFEPGSGEII